MPFNYYDGASWASGVPRYWDGTAWQVGTVKRWTGTEWQVIYPTVAVIDDFEDGSVAGYSVAAHVYEEIVPSGFSAVNGSRVLHTSGRSYRVHIHTIPSDNLLANYPSPGDTIRYHVRLAASSDALFGFGKSTNTTDADYEVGIDNSSGRFYIFRRNSGGSLTGLAADPNVMPQAGVWYEIEIQWGANGDITCTAYNPDGSVFAALPTVNDTTFTGGGVRFAINQEAWFDYARIV